MQLLHRMKVRRAVGRRSRTAVMLLAPAALLFAVFYITPVIVAIVLSFFRWSGLEPPHPVGFENFRDLLADDVLITNLRVTLVAVGAALVGILPTAMLLAVCLSGRSRILPLFRWLLFLPVVMPFAATALLWTEIFSPLEDGLANRALSLLGIDPVAWLGSEGTAIWALLIVTIWSSIGFHIVIQLSSLSTIPTEIKEAAALETPPGWRHFRHVILPLMRDSITVSAALIVTGTFVFFTSLSTIMTRGGPSHSTEVLGLRAYLEAFTGFNFGRASAVTVISMFFSITLVGTILFLGFRRRVEY